MNQNEILTEKFIYLISCALNGTLPQKEMLSDIDFDELFKLAKAHHLLASLGFVFENSEFPEDKTRLFLIAKNKNIRRIMLFDDMRERIFEEMENADIWYTPLKGIIIKDYYPKFGMREMSDNDILYDKSKRKELKKIFIDLGFTDESTGKSVHDTYKKEPIFVFEMHPELFWEDLGEKYKNVKEKLQKDNEKKYLYRFTDEDFYVYTVAHAYKHYSKSGMGFRFLSDIYVINKKCTDMDRAYISSELDNLGIRDFENKNRLLSEKLFDLNLPLSELTDEEKELVLFYSDCGVFGKKRNFINNELNKIKSGETISKKTKAKYLLMRLFPGRKWFKDMYPFLYKFPVFIPFFWVFRLIRGVIMYMPKVKRELKNLKSIKTD